MSERPIIFSPESVALIRRGVKTQTRRVMKPQPCEDLWKILRRYPRQRTCPHGNPGDRLWVREAWAMPANLQPCIRCGIIHPATHLDGCPYITYPAIYKADFDTLGADEVKWRNAMFMPRWASRLTLELTAVRVERLQEISEEDARAEGCASVDASADEKAFMGSDGQWTEKFAYMMMWDSINGKKAPWESNPFVWVLEFCRVEGR